MPSFAITAHKAASVAQVCRRLDGIPLAIELAAACASMLSVDQIAARLDRRFRLLIGGNRTAVRRQQTLQATIDWSYQLLSEEERSLFRRLAVFADGWSLEAAEALGADAQQPAEDVLELLSRLVAKSMVVVDEPRDDESGVNRYRFGETIRQFAQGKLDEADEAELARTRHCEFFLAWAERAAPNVVGRDQLIWLGRLDAEHDNLRAALEWCRGDGSDRELRLAARSPTSGLCAATPPKDAPGCAEPSSAATQPRLALERWGSKARRRTSSPTRRTASGPIHADRSQSRSYQPGQSGSYAHVVRRAH